MPCAGYRAGAVAQLHAAVQAAEAWHITPVTADLRDLAGLHPYAQSRDVVTCNPPYFYRWARQSGHGAGGCAP